MCGRPVKKSSCTLHFCLAVALVSFAGNFEFVSASDRTDLASAVRQFRIRTYQTYRTNRPEYDRQIKRGEQLLHSVENGQINKEDAIRWLRGISVPLGAPTTPSAPTTSNTNRPSQGPMERRSGNTLVRPRVVGTLIPVMPPPKATSEPQSSEHQPPSQKKTDVATTRNVSIDLTVLAARIESTNLELETIGAQLHPDAQRLFPDELVALGDELENAINQHELSQTYVNILQPTQRDRIPRLVPPEPVIASFSQRLFDAQIQAHQRKSGSITDNETNDVRTLRELARRIRTWQSH